MFSKAESNRAQGNGGPLVALGAALISGGTAVTVLPAVEQPSVNGGLRAGRIS